MLLYVAESVWSGEEGRSAVSVLCRYAEILGVFSSQDLLRLTQDIVVSDG